MNPQSSSQSSNRRPRKRLIAGVYNYCDSWCERCVFQEQCRLYLDRQKYETAVARGEDAEQRAIESDLDDEYEYEDKVVLTPAQEAERAAMIEAVNNIKLSPEEERRMTAQFRREDGLRARHPLTINGRAYMNAVLDLREPLNDVASATDDPLVSAALEAIERHALLIGSKTRRASGGLVSEEDEDEDFEEVTGVQSDSNGCAKLVRIVIAESREAWSLLMTVGPLAADGLPMAMIERLDALDAQVQKYFPRAMEFVRSGFDDRVGGSDVDR